MFRITCQCLTNRPFGGKLATMGWLKEAFRELIARDIVPDSNLPFETRWALAANLGRKAQAQFVWQEAHRLTFVVENTRRGPQGINSRTDFRLDQLIASSFPEELKRYFAVPLVDNEYRQIWKDPRVEISVRYPDERMGSGFNMFIGMRDENGRGLGLMLKGSVGSLTKGDVRAQIHHHWEFGRSISALAALQGSRLGTAYRKLQDYLERCTDRSPNHVAHLQVVKELVLFTENLPDVRYPKLD